MTDTLTTTNVDILGQSFVFKCEPAKVEALQRAASYLDDILFKLKHERGVVDTEKLAIMGGLQIANAFLDKQNECADTEKRLKELNKQIEKTIKQSNTILSPSPT